MILRVWRFFFFVVYSKKCGSGYRRRAGGGWMKGKPRVGLQSRSGSVSGTGFDQTISGEGGADEEMDHTMKQRSRSIDGPDGGNTRLRRAAMRKTPSKATCIKKKNCWRSVEGPKYLCIFQWLPEPRSLIKRCAVDNPSTRDIHTYTKPKPTKHAHICSATVTFASLRLVPAKHRTEKIAYKIQKFASHPGHTLYQLCHVIYAGHAFDGCVASPNATRPGCTSSPIAHRVRKG